MKNKIPWIILAILALAGIVYLVLKNRKTAKRLEFRSANWENKKFTFVTPWGPMTIGQIPFLAQGEADTLIQEDENFRLVKRSYPDRLVVAMAHLNENDPLTLSMFTFDYETKTVFPETVTAAEIGQLSGIE